MGVVFKAHQISLGRDVAVKVLPFASALDPGQLRRFEIEARAAAQLHHTNIVPIFSVGYERGVHYYAMQLIEGRTLDVLIRELQAGAKAAEPCPKPRLPRGAARHRMFAELGVQAAEALEHAHRQGIVHRDVKPSNLMVDVRGNLWITDFGLARMDAVGGLTRVGDVLGTLRYMSPEQSSGDPARIDHRTDVYSLGATLYELATLAPVHTGRDRDELLRNRAVGEVRKPRSWDRSIPRDLETILLRALDRDPAQRYQTARDLADDLRRFLDHRPILARRPSPWRRAERWARRHKALSSTLAFAFILTLVGGAVIASLAARNRSLAVRSRDLDRIRRHAEYVRDVGGANQHVRRNNLAQAVDTLARHIPGPGDVDDRTFPWHYLWRLYHVQPRQLKGHVGDVYHVEYSPDGRFLVTAGQDTTARVWDASTGALLRTFRGHEGDVDFATLSPDGRRLATCGNDRTVRLWDALDDTRPSIVLGRHPEEAVSVVFSLDGRTLFSGDDEGRLKTWDVATARETRSIVLPPKARIEGLALSPDGRTLAVATRSPMLLDAQTLEHGADLPGSQATFCVAFSHDGGLVACAEEEGRVRLSNAQTGLRWNPTGVTLPRSGRVVGLAFSPDDGVLAACHDGGIVCLWDVKTGIQMRSYRSGHYRIWGAAFSPDGRDLAVCGTDGAVEIWDARVAQDGRTVSLPRPIDSRVTPVLTSAVFQAAYGNDRGDFHLDPLDLATQQTLSSGALCELPGVQSAALSPDGSRMAVHQIVPPWTQVVFARTNTASPPLEGVPGFSSGTEALNTPRTLVFSPDGTRLAADIGYRGVFVWDVPSGRLLASSPVNYPRLAFSPRGDLLAMARTYDFCVWDLTTRSILDYLDSGLGAPDPITFTPDGRKVVAGFGASRSAAIWNLDDFEGKPVILELHNDPSALAISPDGKIAAFGSNEGTVTLVDLSILRTILTLDARSRPVRVLQFSPDGSTLFAVMYADSKTPPVVTAWTLSPSSPIDPTDSGQR
jgi:WD40 repeat protein/serine/threonine protein kinase